MIVLTNTDTITLETTQSTDFFISYRDISASAFTPGRAAGNTSVDAALITGAAGVSRVIDSITLCNRSTALSAIAIRVNAQRVFVALLANNEVAEYAEGRGWFVRTSAGIEKQNAVFGAPLRDAINTVVLTANVATTAVTMSDVTGLQFPVTAGRLYYFHFEIPYTAELTTTGSRWGVNGPGTAAGLSLWSEYSLTTTTTTRNANVQAYDTPATANASSASLANNRAIIDGIIRANASGFLTARFASEVVGSAITAQAGAFANYQEIA